MTNVDGLIFLALLHKSVIIFIEFTYTTVSGTQLKKYSSVPEISGSIFMLQSEENVPVYLHIVLKYVFSLLPEISGKKMLKKEKQKFSNRLLLYHMCYFQFPSTCIYIYSINTILQELE